jgi:hypothetical protein
LSRRGRRCASQRFEEPVGPLLVRQARNVIEEAVGCGTVGRDRTVFDDPPGAALGDEIDLVAELQSAAARWTSAIARNRPHAGRRPAAADFQLPQSAQFVEQIDDAVAAGRRLGRHELDVEAAGRGPSAACPAGAAAGRPAGAADSASLVDNRRRRSQIAATASAATCGPLPW